MLPAAAGFYRQEPMAKIEAVWRVQHDALVHDFKSKHRQMRRARGSGRDAGDELGRGGA